MKLKTMIPYYLQEEPKFKCCDCGVMIFENDVRTDGVNNFCEYCCCCNDVWGGKNE